MYLSFCYENKIIPSRTLLLFTIFIDYFIKNKIAKCNKIIIAAQNNTQNNKRNAHDCAPLYGIIHKHNIYLNHFFFRD